MVDRPFAEEEVAGAPHLLVPHKSPDRDRIHPMVLEELSRRVSSALMRLFNGSLEQERLTREGRKAKTIPSFKGGSESKASSSHPNFLWEKTHKAVGFCPVTQTSADSPAN